MKLAEKILNIVKRNKLDEMSKRSKLSLFIDENVAHLKEPLRILGYKAYTLDKGLSDDKISELIEGDTVVTRNSQDFKITAVARDIDIIQLNGFIDGLQSSKNITARYIQNVIRKTKYYKLKGNFLITIRASKDYDISELK